MDEIYASCISTPELLRHCGADYGHSGGAGGGESNSVKFEGSVL